LDYSTHNIALDKEEIEYVKTEIKKLYKLNIAYKLDQIIKYVKDSYPKEKQDLFDEFYIYKALNELTPITENELNNFKDIVTDKYNKPGYLIYRKDIYIFQPSDQNEDLPMYYRSYFMPSNTRDGTDLNYFMQKFDKYTEYIKNHSDQLSSDVQKTSEDSKENILDVNNYDFDSVLEYYDSREEYKFVGIIDKASMKKNIKKANEVSDIFKIRDKRPKILEKRRETGVPSFKGAVCDTSKSKDLLIDMANELDIDTKEFSKLTRIEICEHLKNKLFELEKYSTSDKKNKMTYLMIPANHNVYQFPLNLEDRIVYILNIIQDITKLKLDYKIVLHDIDKKPNKKNNIKYVKYEIQIKNMTGMEKAAEVLDTYKAVLIKNIWVINVE
jgi:hypothetical protein